MQERLPTIAEAGNPGPTYHGDYPAKILFALRRFSRGRTLKSLVGELGTVPCEVVDVEDALQDLVELGIVERIMDKEPLWRVSR